MTDNSWTPTAHFRWNRRSDAEVTGFLQQRGIWPMWTDGPRPIGYRLEQKWTRFRTDENCGTGQGWVDQEWRPIPFEDECMEAVPALDTKDRQFWPVRS